MAARFSSRLGGTSYNFRDSRRQQAGFTLIELLVVIAIIGVLIALLLPAVQAAPKTERSRNAPIR